MPDILPSPPPTGAPYIPWLRGNTTYKVAAAVVIASALGVGSLTGISKLAARLTAVGELPQLTAPLALDRGTTSCTTGTCPLDVSAASNYDFTSALTGNIVMPLSGGQGRLAGAIAFAQDGAGGHTATISVTAPAVLWNTRGGASDGVVDVDTAPGALTYLSYEFRVVAGTLYCLYNGTAP